MKSICLVFESRYGQTRKIAEFMTEHLRREGHAVRTYDLSQETEDPSLGKWPDLVVVGAPIYAGQFPRRLVKWVQSQHTHWSAQGALFTVSLNAADQHPEARAADLQALQKFEQTTGWKPQFSSSLRGALKYLDDPWWLRWMMRRISSRAGGPTDLSRNHELTDWTEVTEFMKKIAPPEKAGETPSRSVRSETTSRRREEPTFPPSTTR